MKKSITTMLFAMVVSAIMGQVATQQPTVHERLDRGVVALPAQDKGIFVSWRLLGDDANDVRFDVVRNGKTIAKDIAATNFTDAEGRATSAYSIIAKQSGKKITSKEITPWNDIFYRMSIDRPEGGNTPDGKSYTYSPNDCSVGDVDGDGEYELVLKWEPSNAHDNAHDGYTGDVIFDCYKLTGKRLWRINLGRNIRAGAHYTQFLVYDFDGDGRAEMICKTAPGSIDGKGRYVTEAATDAGIRSIDNTADYRNSYGRILSGEELLTVFSGITGEALHTVWYNPNRAYGVGGKAEYAGWGDNVRMGNRGERYLACVAHLDGIGRNASAVMCRGYYTRSYLWAVDFDGKRLSTKWLHASLSPEEWTLHDGNGKIVKSAKGLKATAYGQGAHSIAVADVDGDGCDEITYGSAAIDNDGSLLYSTGLGHGDAIHLSDLDPDRPGLEFYMVHEARPCGADLRDARTGEILFHEHADEDTGRGMCADIDPNHRGCEMWHICNKEVKDVKGNVISNTMPPMNFRIYWDGDLQEELLGNLDRRPLFPPCLYKWNGKEAEPLPLSNGKMLYEMGNSNSCNWTKATPNLQADIMGDWREELIFWDAKDASHLNIFTTNCPTEYRVPTLMHDHTYRMAVAWQNVCYNQPPHLGYCLPDTQVAKPMEDVNKVVDNTLDSLNKAKTARIPAGTSRKGNNPVLFLIGNSTMRNGTLGNGNNGQWGWGYYAQEFFDENKITVENQALGGMSSRTFYTRLWPDVRKGIRKGDWVIISIGHNDNGPYDSGRARASIPGIGKDTLNVTIKETGVKETVYTYGEYLRKYINDCRAVGANPILMSLTPRDAYDDNGRIVRVDKTFGLWARQVAEQENVPFVDLNEISASKLDAYGPWKEKYHFYTDHIHTSRFGAMMNARSAAEGIAESKDPQLAPLQAMMHNVELPTVEVKREKGKPVVFITGDSTVKNEDKDENGMWGWGSQAYTVFDQSKITCVNCAKAGRSTRTYLNEGRWDKVYNSLQSGDFVLIQFGHNDIGPIDNQKQRGTIACTKDTSHVYKLADSGKYEVVYSFGWYLKKFIQDVREKGATPILVSLTPRNEWPGGNVERRNDSYGKWYREVVKETGVEFVDVHNISADFLDRIGKEKAKEYFNHDHTHTSLTGAKMNAKSVAKGLMRNGSPLAKYLIAQTTIVEDMSKRDPKDNAPFYYSAELPDGNYKVTVVFGSKKKAGKTVVRAECRRLMVDEVSTKKGEFKTVEFTVNKRTPYISDLKSVKIKEREKGYLTWDDYLTLEFTGAAPAVKELRIERDTMATQIFLCGNSTVTDQPYEPYASWGQMAPVWFGSDVVIANHAESGLATSSFIAQGRLDQVMAQMKKGDYVLCEFGHNDQKERRAGSGAWYNFSHNLKEFIDRVRAKGGTIIFVTPTQRRAFDDATHTKIQETHGDYPDAMRAVAQRENVPVIELHDMTRTFFETLGYEGSKESLVHYPANTFPGQTKALADNTHFNPYGAYEVAKMVIMGMKQLNLPIVKSLRQEWKDYDPAQPDDVKTFKWYPAQSVDVTKPAGN